MLSLQILFHNIWRHLALNDKSISLQYTSVLFNQEHGGSYSYSFDLDVDANIAIFGNTPDITGSSIYKLIHNLPARLTLSGVTVIDGILHLEPDVEIKESNSRRQIQISVENRNAEFSKHISGARLRDLAIGVPADNIPEQVRQKYDQIIIGRCLPAQLPFHAFYETKIYKYHWFDGWGGEWLYDSKYITSVSQVISLPHLLFPNYKDNEMGGAYSLNALNVSEPYDPANRTAHPYCNVRVCYQKYNKNDKNDWDKVRGYSIGAPDRVNSAPCFYLGYVLDKAMHDLGIAVRSNSLTDIMDYRRLAFFHTDAQYDIETLHHYPEGQTHGHSSIVPFTNDGSNQLKLGAGYFSGQQYSGHNAVQYEGDDGILRKKEYYITDRDGNHVHRNSSDDKYVEGIIAPTYPLCTAYANALNLPDIEVKDLIADITSLFGARIIYDETSQSLDIIIMRDIMRRADHPIIIPCDINSVHKQENSIHGCVLKYSGAKSQSYNTVTHVPNESQGSDDTAYNYYDYKNVVLLEPIGTTVPDGSAVGPTYLTISASPSVFDHNLYIDQATGNAFRIKVDSNAETQTTWFASTFEVAGYRDVLIGDCSSLSLPESEQDDANVVHTVTIPFSPAIPSISNQGDIRDAISTTDPVPHPVYAQYVDGEIHHNDDNSLIQHNYIYNGIILAEEYSTKEHRTVTTCHMDVLLILESVEDYDVTSSSDGPYYDNECQNTLGIMRGSGAGESVIFFNENYDGFGTSEYTVSAGSDAEFTSDSVNHFGELFDYNGGGRTLVSPDMAKVYLRSYFTSGQWDFSMLFVDDITLRTSVSHNQTTGQYDLRFYYPGTGQTITIRSYDTEALATLHRQLLIDLYTIRTTAQEAECTFPDNGLGYLRDDIISLKLKAEKPINGDPSQGYYPTTSNTLIQNRGIYDKFYAAWFDFLTNHSIAILNITLEPSAWRLLTHHAPTDFLQFGPYRGLLKSATAQSLDDGRLQAKLTLAHL